MANTVNKINNTTKASEEVARRVNMGDTVHQAIQAQDTYTQITQMDPRGAAREILRAKQVLIDSTARGDGMTTYAKLSNTEIMARANKALASIPGMGTQ